MSERAMEFDPNDPELQRELAASRAAIQPALDAIEVSAGRQPSADPALPPEPREDPMLAFSEQRLFDALKALNDLLPQVDNGYCAICKIGHRSYDLRGRVLYNCSNQECVSHQVYQALHLRNVRPAQLKGGCACGHFFHDAAQCPLCECGQTKPPAAQFTAAPSALPVTKKEGEEDQGLPVGRGARSDNKHSEFGGTVIETTPATRETAPPTQGPWSWTTFCKPSGDPILTVDDVAETIAGSAHYSPSADLYGVTLNDADLNEDGKATVVCYTGNGPNAHNNARVIAAMPIMVGFLRHLLNRDHGFVYSLDRADAKALLSFIERGTSVPLSFGEASGDEGGSE